MTPNHRNLSTVGIDGFVCDPGNDLEIAGDIKTNPEDFLVREIGYVPPSRSVETAERSTAGGNNYHQMERLGWIRALAGLQNEGQAADEVCEPASKKKPRTKVDLEDEATSRCDVSSPTVDLDSTSQVAQKTIDEVKAKDLAEFLLQQDGINVEATLEKLRSLHDSALASVTSSIEKSGQNEDGRLKVWLETEMVRNSSDWRDLHRLVRQDYPFLQTETSKVGPDGSSSGEKRWIYAYIDTTFLPIVPFLAKPCEDLVLLYKFRNDGPVPSTMSSRNGFRRRSHSKSKKKCVAPVSIDDSSNGTIRLRLRTDLPRDQRRAVHQIISKASRSLETTTQNGLHIDPSDPNSLLTSAIVVSWSRNALSSKSKRKRQAPHAAAEDRLFCVLKKVNMEHQLAMTRITRALRCRNSDVGVAGKINIAEPDSILLSTERRR